ncbi:Ff.00g132830.m01.CDS01 [Fusarium sp. VM40]|nr:Ff.00g132830.m01.CDS01 [Fusarium sp. VM40]
MPQAKSSNYLGDMSTDASKSRRERNREAQQQFRKRRQAAEAARLQRLKRLEGVIERMSTVIVGYADKMLQEDVLKQYPALAADTQDVIANVLALANEAGDPEDKSAAEPIEGTTPNYLEEEPRRGDIGALEDQPVSSDIPTFSLPPNEQSINFINESMPQYHHFISYPSRIYPDSAIGEVPYLPPSTLPPSIGLLPWSTIKPLSPTSFTHQLTHTCFNVGFLLLTKSPNSPVPLADEARVFGSTLRSDERNEMMTKVTWFMGPGRDDMKFFALMPLGRQWQDKSYTTSELTKTTNKPALPFCSVLGVERQLATMGAHIVAKDTLELAIDSTIDDEDQRRLQPESWSFVNIFPPGVLRLKSELPSIRVSISLLVKNLSEISVCLSGGPGFPRKRLGKAIVDSAIKNRVRVTPYAVCV